MASSFVAVFVGSEAEALVASVAREAGSSEEARVVLPRTEVVASLVVGEAARESAVVYCPVAGTLPNVTKTEAACTLCCPTRDGAPVAFDEACAAWCASRGVEYVFAGSDDREDGLPRILAALAEASAAETGPSVAVLGDDDSLVHEALRSAFPSAADPTALRLETKYYDAEVAVKTELDESAEAVVLVGGMACEFWNDEFDVQTKIVFASDVSLDEWCRSRGFERVDPHADGLPRLQAALQCTLWSNMVRKERHVDTKNDDAAETRGLLAAEDDARPADDDVDLDVTQDLEDLLTIVNDARAGTQSDQARRDRAADVALRLARSLGIDDDDDDDDD